MRNENRRPVGPCAHDVRVCGRADGPKPRSSIEVGLRHILLVPVFVAIGCGPASSGDSASKARAGASEDDGAASGSLKELELRTGLLGVNDVFVETGTTLYTCENAEGNGQFALQVGAEVMECSTSTPSWCAPRTTLEGRQRGGGNEVYWSQDGVRRPGGTAKR